MGDARGKVLIYSESLTPGTPLVMLQYSQVVSYPSLGTVGPAGGGKSLPIWAPTGPPPRRSHTVQKHSPKLTGQFLWALRSSARIPRSFWFGRRNRGLKRPLGFNGGSPPLNLMGVA